MNKLYPQSFVDKVGTGLGEGIPGNHQLVNAALFARFGANEESEGTGTAEIHVHVTGNIPGTLFLALAALRHVIEEMPPETRQQAVADAFEATGLTDLLS